MRIYSYMRVKVTQRNQLYPGGSRFSNSTLNRSRLSRQPSANDVDSAIPPLLRAARLLLDYLPYPTIRTIFFVPRRRFSAVVFVSLPSSSPRLAAADVPSSSDGRTDRHTKSRIPRLFLASCVTPVPLTCSLSSFRIASPCFSFLLVPFCALSTVISTERRRLSFQPSFHSTLRQPTPTARRPSDASSFLRIFYVRGKEFDSVVPARKTSSGMCAKEQAFLSQRELRRRCFARDDVELETLDRYLC